MARRRFFLAGVDEAGRGPLAGPVTACCICLPPRFRDERVNDSKQLTHEMREELARKLERSALAFSVVSVGPRRIEQRNIRNATLDAMRRAASNVLTVIHRKNPNASIYLLVDGNMSLGNDLANEPIVDGDSRCFSISAASILAKVHRDRLMLALDKRYPGYGFAAHKGYGTAVHRECLRELGPTRVHRRTFAGVAEYFGSASAIDGTGDADDQQMGLFEALG